MTDPQQDEVATMVERLRDMHGSFTGRVWDDPDKWKTIYSEAAALLERLALDAGIDERVAVLRAHRACGGEEHDPQNGKLHGCCVVCLVPWPCEYAARKL